MSATEHYLNQGYTPKNKTIVIQESAAVAVWTPLTSTRVVVTELGLSTNLATTVAFYWGSAGDKIAEFLLPGSAAIVPSIGIWEGTAYDRGLYARASIGSTDGVRVNLTGFEIPQW